MPKQHWTPYRKRTLLKKLDELYPDPQSELKFKNDYQLLTSVMLSAQCTDKKVNQVTPILYKEYPTFKKLSEAKLLVIENIIRPINYYKTKSKNLIATAEMVTKLYKGKIPTTHELLTGLPGVGRKTANVVLSEKGIVPAVPVDTHVYRVSRRLGIAQHKNRDRVEEEIKDKFNPKKWRELHHWLIFHGRRVCKAQNPLCAECTLSRLCPSANE